MILLSIYSQLYMLDDYDWIIIVCHFSMNLQITAEWQLASAGASATDFTFNLRNNIYENDTTLTPAQFIYEAADCRLWFQPQHYSDITTRWTLTAAQAFGLNETSPYSMCVQGSTNQSSSLSGNATLFDNGVPDNVTTFIPEGQSSSGKKNGATQVGVSAVASLVFAAAIALAF